MMTVAMIGLGISLAGVVTLINAYKAPDKASVIRVGYVDVVVGLIITTVAGVIIMVVQS